MAGPTETLFFRSSTARDHNAFGRDEETQRVVILGRNGAHSFGPGRTLAQLCDALDIEVIHVESHHDLPIALHRYRPMAVASGMAVDALMQCSALRSVAAFDPDLPVLLITGDDPALQGAVDAAEQLWGLSQLCRLPEDPGPQDMMRFLFLAGRHTNTGRMLPI